MSLWSPSGVGLNIEGPKGAVTTPTFPTVRGP